MMHTVPLTYLPLGLFQTWSQLGLLSLDGGTPSLQCLSVLQQRREVILQLLFLLLQLKYLLTFRDADFLTIDIWHIAYNREVLRTKQQRVR